MSIELDRVLTRSAQKRIPLAELEGWYDQLDGVACDFMLGRWNGGVFNTGHPGEPMLEQLNWIGKNFDTLEDVSPIVCRNAEGKRIVNPVMGAARLRSVVHRGRASAAMLYDKHPIVDYFRRLDEHSVLGVMDRKGDAFPLYFYLRRLG